MSTDTDTTPKDVKVTYGDIDRHGVAHARGEDGYCIGCGLPYPCQRLQWAREEEGG